MVAGRERRGPVPPVRGGRRRRDAADARAPGSAARAGRDPRRGGGHPRRPGRAGAGRGGGGGARVRGEIVPVCAPAGRGIDELRAALERAAAGLHRAPPDGPARLHLDRSFTLRGAGTVVTGHALVRRSRRATACASCRAASRRACARWRSTTAGWTGRRRPTGGAQPGRGGLARVGRGEVVCGPARTSSPPTWWTRAEARGARSPAAARRAPARAPRHARGARAASRWRKRAGTVSFCAATARAPARAGGRRPL